MAHRRLAVTAVEPVCASSTSSRATVSIGRCVADKPMRCSGAAPPHARAALALGPGEIRADCPQAVAWISSTMTVLTDRRIARLRSAVTSRYSDSGVVIGNLRRPLQHGRALGRPGIPSAHRDSDVPSAREAEPGGYLEAISAWRPLGVLPDIHRQRLQRRHVHGRPAVRPSAPPGTSASSAR